MSGKMPVLRLMLQMLAIGPARIITAFFRTTVGIWSAPMAWVFFIFLIILVTDPGVTNFKENELFFFPLLTDMCIQITLENKVEITSFTFEQFLPFMD